MFISPFKAKAGFFSSVLGDEAYAADDIPLGSDKNLQTMDLLQANLSSALDNETDADPKIDSGTALLPAMGPMGSSKSDSIGIGSGDFNFEDISVYVVRSGDTVSIVAEMFGVTPDTILYANDMKKGDKLKEGEVLLILPFSGIEHTVAKGQTLLGIANLYKVDVDEILINNDIELDSKLVLGEKLMIPGASIPNEAGKKSSSGNIAKSKLYAPNTNIVNANGYFINPVPNGRRTRGITGTHRGVDFGAPTGSPIYASADGRVKIARSGYNGGFGTLVIISHPNGTETLYGHMSRLGTSTGAQVKQGETIGFVGSTGRSTGPHLHFEVRGARNPGTDGSWKY